jgi:hypothetical protein
VAGTTVSEASAGANALAEKAGAKRTGAGRAKRSAGKFLELLAGRLFAQNPQKSRRSGGPRAAAQTTEENVALWPAKRTAEGSRGRLRGAAAASEEKPALWQGRTAKTGQGRLRKTENGPQGEEASAAEGILPHTETVKTQHKAAPDFAAGTGRGVGAINEAQGRVILASAAGFPQKTNGEPRQADAEKAFSRIVPAENTLKKRLSGKEKKLSMSEASPQTQRKKDKLRETALKSESPAVEEALRELKNVSPEEARQDSSRQEIQMRVTLRPGDERFADSLRAAGERSVKESASGLLRHLREDGNSKIIQSARIILKDSAEGEIRLILKPEALGEVKIRLALQDKLIAGQILVENESVREVFERNMSDLAGAFKANGFEMSGMDVFTGEGNAAGSGGEGSSPENFFAQTFKAVERERSLGGGSPLAPYAFHAISLMA